MKITQNRRQFVSGLAAGSGAVCLLAETAASGRVVKPGAVRTVQDAIDLIIHEIVEEPLPRTIDTVKMGDPSQELKGIASTFLATLDVLHRAHALGVNLIIPHEPTWYNHYDHVAHLEGDPVYEAKRKFLEETGMVIWRFHDYSHRTVPDVIIQGVVRRLGWENCRVDPAGKILYDIPERDFEDLCQHCKRRLGIANLRVVGNPRTRCRRVALFVGWGGGGILDDDQIVALAEGQADVVICGESAEWVTCEYVRDAVTAGIPKGLIILGHANSEEPGTADIVNWLQPLIPHIPVHFVPAGDPFRFI